MTQSGPLLREARAAQARAARLGQDDTARALAGIAAMIADLEAEAAAARVEAPSRDAHERAP